MLKLLTELLLIRLYKLQTKSITLEGDVYNPSGTLEGGSKPSSAGILKDIQTLKEYKRQLKNYQQELDDLNAEIKSTQKIADKYNQIKGQLDLKTYKDNIRAKNK